MAYVMFGPIHLTFIHSSTSGRGSRAKSFQVDFGLILARVCTLNVLDNIQAFTKLKVRST